MSKHKEIYDKAFGIASGEYRASECSGLPGVDVHAIDCDGMGGRKTGHRIENLIALTRKEHIRMGDKKHYKAILYMTHKAFMDQYGVKYDREWIDNQIKKYESFKIIDADET